MEEVIVIRGGPSEGLGWRIYLTILIGIGWLGFGILWLFFYAGTYDIYQNIAVFIVSVLAAMGLAAMIWVSFGLRMARLRGGDALKEAGRWMGWKGIVSMIIWIGWLVWLVAWLFYYAAGYNFYQNLALVIVSLLIAGALSWAVNIPALRRH